MGLNDTARKETVETTETLNARQTREIPELWVVGEFQFRIGHTSVTVCLLSAPTSTMAEREGGGEWRYGLIKSQDGNIPGTQGAEPERNGAREWSHLART